MEIVKTRRSQYKYLNFNGDEVKYNDNLSVLPDTIPTTIPAAMQAKWIKEEKPDFAIQEIDVPVRANGFVYDIAFFNSFFNGLQNRPYPGSAGHHHDGRGETCLLLVGGKVIDNGDGTGKAFLKNYFLPTETGKKLKDEFDSKMIHFSLVSRTRDQLEKSDQGDYTWHVVASEGAERNDAIDNGAGAMSQKTNTDEQGKVNEIENDIEVIDTPKENKGVNMAVTKEEAIAALKLNNATIPEILTAMGASDQVLTAEHKNAFNLSLELKKINAADPVKEITDLRATAKKNFDMMRGIRLDKEFEPVKIKIGDEEKTNTLREYASKMLSTVSDMDFENALTNFKENDNVAKSLAAEKADWKSKYNQILVTKSQEKKEAPVIVNGAQLVTY
jgi:hypothetical protein